MSLIIKNSIKKNSPHFRKYKKYIEENDWRNLTWDSVGKPKTDVDIRKGEFDVQNDLVKAIVERLKTFVKKAEGDHHLKIFKDFVKDTLKIIELHNDRSDKYTTDSNISSIKDVDLRAGEVAFHNHLFKAVSSIEDAVSALNIKEDATEANSISFHENTKIAQLCMHEILYKEYPSIKRIIDSMGIDFTSPPKNEMHIHNENPPQWNPDKHYFLQEKETLQYYVDEYKKLENGIIIDGLEMEPWLYFHINHFVTEIPTVIVNKQTGEEKIKKVVKVPPLRDNEYYIIQDNYREARKTGKILFIAATRRLFKSTGLASHLYHKAITGGKELLVAGGSAKDLGQLEKNIKVCSSNINPAFAVNNISSDWTKKIPLGIRTKANKILSQCIIHIVNLDGGLNSEILAGYTPDALCVDECLKQPFIEQLNGAKPSFDTPNGMLCTPILSGTGGDEEMSRDGHKVLNDPKSYKVLEMNWDALERGVPTEEITWSRRNFGTFAPAAMSAKTGMIKVKSNLAKYLNRPDSKELEKIEILLTDWATCNKIIDFDRASLSNDRESLTKEIVYYPKDASEIFKSGKTSPFDRCLPEARAHKEFLISTGKWDRRRELYRDSNGDIQVKLSTKELAKFPHKGGIVDAPFLIFEDPPKEKPKYGTYIGSFDDYAVEDSDTDSVSTFYVIKNKILGDPFSEKIVASISFRPEKHSTVHEKWLMLMEAYNLEGTSFGENFNYAIKDYLDRKHVADKYLAPSLDFTQSFNLPNNLKRKTGWSPIIKRSLFNLFVDYCNEEFEFEQEDGSVLTLKGVQRIDDIWLLEEIIQYTDQLNVDRLSSAQACVSFMHYLNSSFKWRPGVYKKEEPTEKIKPKQERPISHYNTGRNRGFYSKGRR